MARRAFRVIDVIELYQHWHAGRRVGELSTSLGLDPKTVRKYLAPALAAGMTPGGPPLGAAEWQALVEGWFPGLHDRSLRQPTWPAIAVHHNTIKDLIGKVHVTTIHQRLRDDCGLEISESSLRRYIEVKFADEVARRDVRVLRETPPAGEEVLCGIPHRHSYGARVNMRRDTPFRRHRRCSVPIGQLMNAA
ncbi:MAG: hypothetical protein M0Z46_09620 [Actinomycetota bacterium]|jgi:hypothetical protein|nr:hypothetical protein [Actinomycetota bacterium]MDA8357575.1 hypothetical protein [Actinomycetota bacterium]